MEQQNGDAKAEILRNTDGVVVRVRNALCGDQTRRSLYFRRKTRDFKESPAYTFAKGRTIWGRVTKAGDDMIFMGHGENASLVNG